MNTLTKSVSLVLALFLSFMASGVAETVTTEKTTQKIPAVMDPTKKDAAQALVDNKNDAMKLAESKKARRARKVRKLPAAMVKWVEDTKKALDEKYPGAVVSLKAKKGSRSRFSGRVEYRQDPTHLFKYRVAIKLRKNGSVETWTPV